MSKRTTFNVDDWITHTPKDILAKNFGVDESLFDDVPTPNPYILQSNATDGNVTSPFGKLEGNSSYVYHLSRIAVPPAPGGGGTLAKVDSRNFPIATTIAAAIVTLEPHGLRELHWHPNVSISIPRSLTEVYADGTCLGRGMAILPPGHGSGDCVPRRSPRSNV